MATARGLRNQMETVEAVRSLNIILIYTQVQLLGTDLGLLGLGVEHGMRKEWIGSPCDTCTSSWTAM